MSDPCTVEEVQEGIGGKNTPVRITICQGKNRQVREAPRYGWTSQQVGKGCHPLRTNLLRVKAAPAEAAVTAAAGALILLLAGEEDASGRKQPGIDPASRIIRGGDDR